MLLPKDVSNNFAKAMFFWREIIKIVSVISTQTVILV